MHKTLQPFWLLLYSYGTVIGSELLLRQTVWGAVGGEGLPYLLGFSLPPALLIWMAASALPGRGGKMAGGILLGLAALLYSTQMIYYQVFHTFYVSYSLLHSAQVWQFWKIAAAAVTEHAAPFLLFWTPLVLYCALVRRLPAQRIAPLDAGVVVIVALAAHLFCLNTLPLGGTESLSAYDLYFNTQYMDAGASRLGMAQAFSLDVRRLLFGFVPRDKPADFHPALPSSSQAQESRPEASSSEPAVPAMATTAPKGANSLPIDFDTLAQAEQDPEIADMHRYFAGVEPSRKNEMTGRFRGDNLILITAEAFSPYAVDPKLTPTLYKLVHEGMFFSNYYTPGWGVSTSDGEYVALQSLIPMSGVWSMYRSSRNELPFTMGNQLRSLGYAARAYHNNTFDYYGRDESHPNLGFDYKGLGNGLEVRKTWPESDLEMVDVTTGEYLGAEPFVTYYMTVSGHMLYTWDGNYIAGKNRALVDSLPLSDPCKAYLACNIELDRALELLLKRLDEAGVAERTVIALTADHYPYGLTQAEMEELAGGPVEENFELYRNSLILYQKGMEPLTVDRPASSLDILPTLSNLFGVAYDSRLLMGRDLFSDAEPLVIFANRSWISQRGRYNSLTNVFEPAEGREEDPSYVKAVRALVNDRFYYSAEILKKDYFAKALGIVNDRPPMEIWSQSGKNDPEGPPISAEPVSGGSAGLAPGREPSAPAA